MTCTHCNNNLPEGLIMCFHCGKPLESPAVSVQPEYFTAPEPTQPPRPVQPPYPVQVPVHAGQTGGKKKGLKGIVAAAVVVLLIGGTVGGHFLGFYTLPLLPERADTIEAAPPIDDAPPNLSENPDNDSQASVPEPPFDYVDVDIDVDLSWRNITNDQLAEMISTGEIPENVTRLFLAGNEISDLTPLSGLTNLTDLSLNNNQISEVAPLAELTGLKNLYLADNQISDINPLRALTNLERLTLSNNPILYSSPLFELTNLIRLDIDGTPLTPVTVDALFAVLPNCEIIYSSGHFAEPSDTSSSASVSLNMELVGWIGRTNGQLRAAFGDEASSGIWHGGTPIVNYDTPDTARSYIVFWLDGDYDEMYEAFHRYANLPLTNIWPDHFTIFAIEIWEDSVPRMYDTAEFYITPEMMNKSFGQSPEMWFVSVHDNVIDGYAFDVWYSEYVLEEYTLYVTFRENEDGGDLYLFHTLITGRH